MIIKDLKAHSDSDFLQQGYTYSNKAIPPNSATPYGPAFKHMILSGPYLFKQPHHTASLQGSGRLVEGRGWEEPESQSSGRTEMKQCLLDIKELLYS